MQVASLRVKEKVKLEREADASQVRGYFEGGQLVGAFRQVINELVHGTTNILFISLSLLFTLETSDALCVRVVRIILIIKFIGL